MQIRRCVLAVTIAGALAACGLTIPDINARPDKYYQHQISFVGQIARTQVLSSDTLLEITDVRDHRILVRSTTPVGATTGDWVKVTGVLVPQAVVGDKTVYDVVTAERISRTRAPRLANLF
jgi:hypothetical protein